ncbi:sugar phosphate nucleotidyltransferase [Saprospira sp. CCB-QB6]|uniref:sugar phosphate nucleotidyltransferase n=1 Tax=Saprospira sp. CCB-QB6 TaxID=3023936 RepID=UPI00234B25FB|nr:sugar phosphate nucleotidyltransferase [Saprospira sp. CCB-QB6]WCL81189.1 sugar phosphate nucleotidyltransferase [Saprospira sp. CCB-QB6]
MKLIIPMAGRGTRLRPHSITVPKPLVSVAGKPIVARLVEDLAKACPEPIDEIAFIIGDFGEQVEGELKALAQSLGAKGSIYQQTEKLGTAHAILCAKESLQGPVIVAFADTLFQSNFKLNMEEDGLIWVKKVADPSAYGVVKLDQSGYVTDFVEKPSTFVSDLAIVGIYYFQSAENLEKELQYLVDNNIMDRGEYQLTNALENMKNKGLKFSTSRIDEWLDCGNKKAVVYANQRVLEIKEDAAQIASDLKQSNSVVIPPCFIGEGVVLENAVVGPHASIGKGSLIRNSIVQNSLIQENSQVEDAVLRDTMLGAHVKYKGQAQALSLGDYSEYSC